MNAETEENKFKFKFKFKYGTQELYTEHFIEG